MSNITELCNGCEKIDKDNNCKVYPNPSAQMRWVDGKASIGCAFNAKAHITEKTVQTKQRVGQQKQKKK